MTSPTRQESGPLQEWAPLTTLLQKIPSKIQTGIFTQDINFTCLDAIADFIAIGTNHGVVYWFDRNTSQLETFGCEVMQLPVTYRYVLIFFFTFHLTSLFTRMPIVLLHALKLFLLSTIW